MRLPPSEADPSKYKDSDSSTSGDFNTTELREAFLVRRARDAGMSSSNKNSIPGTKLTWRLGPSTGEKMGGVAAGWGPRGLVEGIGIDARRYVEGLLSLNR